jgi:hypothetical protein
MDVTRYGQDKRMKGSNAVMVIEQMGAFISMAL